MKLNMRVLYTVVSMTLLILVRANNLLSIFTVRVLPHGVLVQVANRFLRRLGGYARAAKLAQDFFLAHSEKALSDTNRKLGFDWHVYYGEHWEPPRVGWDWQRFAAPRDWRALFRLKVRTNGGMVVPAGPPVLS